MRALSIPKMRLFFACRLFEKSMAGYFDEELLEFEKLRMDIAMSLGHASHPTVYYNDLRPFTHEASEKIESSNKFLKARARSLRIGEMVKIAVERLEPSTLSDNIGHSGHRSRNRGRSELGECYVCKNALIGDASGRSRSVLAARSAAPEVPGLLRQQHDLDRVDSLAVHLNALDEQLRPESPRPSSRQKSRGK